MLQTGSLGATDVIVNEKQSA